QPKVSEVYFTQGLKKYLEDKDFDGAIAKFEDALKFDKGNKKAKTFLVKILIEYGSELYLKREYTNALPYLKKAYELSPDNSEVKQMYELTVKQTSPGDVSQQDVVSSAGAGAKDMLNLFTEFQKQQEKVISDYFGPQQQTMVKMISQLDTERKELLTVLATGGKELSKISRTLVWGGISGILFIALLIFLIGMYTNYASAKREAILMKHQEKVLGILKNEFASLSSGIATGGTAGRALPSGQENLCSRELICDPNPHVRARGIEVIEAELIEEQEDTAKEIAEKLLVPYLNDPDNRVRANAVKAIYKYNKKLSMETVQSMIRDNNKWMRMSAAWVLGELSDEETSANLLCDCINDEDDSVKKRIAKSLEKLLSTGKVSKALTVKVKKIVEEVLPTEVPAEANAPQPL
ncbi:MAG: HEAT repeat domain-containing protein, partial [Elusimicrobiota bacterium]